MHEHSIGTDQDHPKIMVYTNTDTAFFYVPGHRSFLSFIYLDYCYNNAVMHVFTHLLVDAVRKEEEGLVSNVELVGPDKVHKTPSKSY